MSPKFSRPVFLSSLLIVLFSLCCLPAFAQNSGGLKAALEQMLDRADGYLANNRLRTPASENAYDRYKAVLLLDPANARAKEGLQAISKRYLEMAFTAMDRQRFYQAGDLIDNAEAVGGKSERSERVRKLLAVAEEKARKANLTVARLGKTENLQRFESKEETKFLLDGQQLSSRGDDISNKLRLLGIRVGQTREYVLIHARNDAEGRWIYQQMRKASEGYRLRGDIRRSKTPKVILQDPLE